MKRRPFGTTGMEVSEIGLGAWQLANPDWQLDDTNEALRIVEQSLVGVDPGVVEAARSMGASRSAILLGVMLLGETIAPRQFAGLSLIALGLLINDGRPLEFLRGLAAGLRSRADGSGPSAAPMLNEPHHSQ